MTGFDMTYNTDELPEDDRSFDLLPNGRYPLQFIEAEVAPTKDGSGTLLNYTAEVIEGSYERRRVWGRINLRNQSEKAEEIGMKQFGSLLRALGIPGVQAGEDPMTVLGYKPFVGLVGVEKGKDNYPDKNKINKFETYGQIAQAPPVSRQAAPPPNLASAPAPARSHPAAPAGRPWGQPRQNPLDDEIPF